MGFLKRKSFWAIFGSLVVLSYVCVIVTVFGVLAAIQNRFDFKFSSDETISKAIENNYFSVTREIEINSELRKSAIVISGDANLNEPVSNDVVFVGEKFNANAPINNNLYFIGEDIYLNSVVKNNANGSARNLVISKDSEILGNASFELDRDFELDGKIAGDLDIKTTGDVTINGVIEGDSRIVADNVYLNGNLVGNVDVNADSVYVEGILNGTFALEADRLEVLESSEIANLRFSVEKSVISEQAAILVSKEFESVNVDEPRLKLDLEDEFEAQIKFSEEGSTISSFVAQVIFAMLILFFAKSFMKRVKDYSFSEPVNAFKKGALVQLAVIGGILVGFISLIGIPVSFLIIAMMIFIWSIATAINASAIALYIKEKYADRIMVNEYILVLAIIGIWTFISEILPFAEFIAFIFSLIIFGGIYKIYNSKEIVTEAEVI